MLTAALTDAHNEVAAGTAYVTELEEQLEAHIAGIRTKGHAIC